MNGFLGTEAPLLSDLSLVLSLALAGLAVFGALRARQERFSTHCPVMAAGMLLNWVPVLVVMIPTWIAVLGGGGPEIAAPFSSAPILHGVLGAVTQLAMTYTVTRMYWLEQLPPERPIWLMRATLVLWLLTIVGGAAVYIVSYVL